MASGGQFGYRGSLLSYDQLREERESDDLGTTDAPAGATVIRMEPQQVYVIPTPPRDHIIWSLCTMCYLNIFCLGFMALVFSVKARDRKMLGDYSGAASYGCTAKWLNITALLLCFLVVGAAVIVVASVFAT